MNCLADLENSLKIVESGGLIMGDDYYSKAVGVKKVIMQLTDFVKDICYLKKDEETQFVIRV